jgi:secreted trypsin-like serine protease
MTRRRFPLAFALPLALAVAAALSAVATTAAAAALPPEGTPEWKQAIFEAMGGTEAALRPTPAIVGGATAPTTRFSHQVALAFYLPQYSGWGQYCGGSLIREDVVLTAAHCDPSVDDGYIMGTNLNHVANFWQWTTYGTLAVKARSVVKHPSFVSNSGVNANDLALVFLNACATPDARTSIIKLANSTEWAANVNSTLLMSGWGTTSVNADATTGMNGNPPVGGQLQYGQANYVSSQTCATLAGLGNAAKATMLCAGTVPATGITTPPIQDTCQGDSGGPIIYNAGSPSSPLAGANANDRLVGVTSWGDGCGRAGKPGVYANVPNLLSWIETTLAAVRSGLAYMGEMWGKVAVPSI